MKRLTVPTVVLVLSFFAVSPIQALAFMQTPLTMNDFTTDMGLTGPHAQTAWPSVHRDSRNSAFVPFVASLAMKKKWTALDGASVLAAVTIGPEGNLYVTTGKETGSTLHAFKRDGTPLWSANLDSTAVASSAIIDADGDLYISDSDQFWAYRANGTVKWVAPIPDAKPGANFVSAAFSVQGYVGGITMNGLIVLFNRLDGTFVNQLALPQGTPVTSVATPTGLWGKGVADAKTMMDPAIVDDVFAAFFGMKFQVVNTPAINPLNNRIYISAAGPEVNGQPTGRLYGIDITSGGSLRIAFGAAMGARSGTSPTISPDGARVYVSDGDGNIYSFDAFTGQQLWNTSIGSSAGAPSVGPDGTVYSLGGEKLNALSPSGSILWSKDFTTGWDWNVGELPGMEASISRLGSADSIISVTAKALYVTATAGYQIQLPPPSNMPFLIPVKTALFTLGFDGSQIAPPVALRDTVEGFVTIASDGSMYVTHGAIRSSIAVNGVIPSLPAGIKGAFNLMVERPVGGISALEPASFLNLVRSGIQWVQELNAAAIAKLNAGGVADVDEAYTVTRRGFVQLAATSSSIDDAQARGEVQPANAQAARGHVNTARTHLNNAKGYIVQGRIMPTPILIAAAKQSITDAGMELNQALSFLSFRFR